MGDTSAFAVSEGCPCKDAKSPVKQPYDEESDKCVQDHVDVENQEPNISES